MKDLRHHVKQLNRKVLRSERREEETDAEIEEKLLQSSMRKEDSSLQARKKEKHLQKQHKEVHIPHPKTPEEKNQKMRERTPIIRDRSHNPPSNK